MASSSRNSFVVRTTQGRYQVFVFDRDTRRPRTLATGSEVSVVSVPGGEPGVRQATSVTVTREATAAGTPGTDTPVPASVRSLERQIERQVRRYGVGVRAGVGLDPELILAGVHAQVPSGFSRNITFRPNVMFGWGEISSMFSLNLEAVYRLPITARQGRWTTYFGAGPGFNFIQRDLDADGRDIDFGDFRYDTCFNILGGVQNRNGMFFELKTSIYAEPAPTLRLMIGYNF